MSVLALAFVMGLYGLCTDYVRTMYGECTGLVGDRVRGWEGLFFVSVYVWQDDLERCY